MLTFREQGKRDARENEKKKDVYFTVRRMRGEGEKREEGKC